MLKQHNFFSLTPNAHGASHAATTGAAILAETLAGHNMLLPESEINAHLAMQGAVPSLNRQVWATAWAKASPTTSGYDEGSKFWCCLEQLPCIVHCSTPART